MSSLQRLASKVCTYFHMVTVVVRSMLFWSPATFRRAQCFVHQIIRWDYKIRTANPRLRTVPLSSVVCDFDLEVVRIVEYRGRHGGVSLLELLVLCLIAYEQKPRTILEIGTFEGITTLNLALNTPDSTRIFSVDLPPGAETRFKASEPEFIAVPAQANLWRQYGVEGKINQILCDTGLLNRQDLPGNIDMVFVDGSHTYDYVINDSRLALEVLSPCGVVIWHDFKERSRGVFSVLNELADRVLISHMEDTTLAIHFASSKGRQHTT